MVGFRVRHHSGAIAGDTMLTVMVDMVWSRLCNFGNHLIGQPS